MLVKFKDYVKPKSYRGIKVVKINTVNHLWYCQKSNLYINSSQIPVTFLLDYYHYFKHVSLYNWQCMQSSGLGLTLRMLTLCNSLATRLH